MLLNPIRLKPLSFWFITIFLALLLSLLSAGFLGTSANADDDPEVPTIPLSEVKQNIGKMGIVLMIVNSGNLLGDQKIAFLNSKTDYKDADNFTVVIKGEGLKAFAEKKIENPADH